MTKKLVLILAVFTLVILPFLVGAPIGKYSPYVEANSLKTYLFIWILISIGFVSIVLLVSKYYSQFFGSLFIGGSLLFLLICPIVGIIGLAAAPDLSIKMLEHPEREHLRYVFLFIAALLFGAFSIFLFSSHSLKIGQKARRLLLVIFILAFAEFIWEFSHHYLYPEAMKEWIDQGKNAEEFSKNYDSIAVVNTGVLGRLIQFSLLIWLSLQLYKHRQINMWCPAVILVFSLMGIVSALVVYATQMNIPKGFEIVILFFIPGMPFMLFYWLGVGILTKFRKTEVAG